MKRKTFDAICDMIAEGKSLRAAAAEMGATHQGFLSTIGRDETGELRDQYARAREAQADHHADEIIEIADTEGDPAKARVRVDARKWVASKLRPKKYGDRIDHDHKGSITITLPDGATKL